MADLGFQNKKGSLHLMMQQWFLDYNVCYVKEKKAYFNGYHPKSKMEWFKPICNAFMNSRYVLSSLKGNLSKKKLSEVDDSFKVIFFLCPLPPPIIV